MRKYIYSLLFALLAVSVPLEVVAQDSTPPTAPGNVKVDLAGTRFVRLSWDAATDDSGSVTYEVEEDDVTPPHSVSGPEWISPVANLLPETVLPSSTVESHSKPWAEHQLYHRPIAELTKSDRRYKPKEDLPE